MNDSTLRIGKKFLVSLLSAVLLLPLLGIQQTQEIGADLVATIDRMESGGTIVAEAVLKPAGAPVTVSGPGGTKLCSVINWTEGYIDIVGEGGAKLGETDPNIARLQAERAATLDAQRKAVELIYQVRVSSVSIFRDLRLDSDVVESRVQGILRGARVVASQRSSDTTMQVVLRVPLKSVSDLVHNVFEHPSQFGTTPEAIEAISPEKLPETEVKIPESTPVVKPVEQPTQAGPFTGVVIDCRGYKFDPSIAPKIRRPNGKEVWGTMDIDPDTAHDYGIAAFLSREQDLQHPEVSSRIGNRYLVIRAIGVAGAGKTDAVISNEDADKLLAENKKTGFLDRLGVAFLYDRKLIAIPVGGSRALKPAASTKPAAKPNNPQKNLPSGSPKPKAKPGKK